MTCLWLVGHLCMCVYGLCTWFVCVACCLARLLESICFKGCFDILSSSPSSLMPAICLNIGWKLEGLWICPSATLSAVWRWADMPFAQTETLTLFVTVVWWKKDPCKCQAKFPAAQMSRWPFGCMWFCLLYVEVLFCCMRRSAVSLGCSEPGWERWREGTAQTHRLYPEWRKGTFSQNIVCALKSHPFLYLSSCPQIPSSGKLSDSALMNMHCFWQPVLLHECKGITVQ